MSKSEDEIFFPQRANQEKYEVIKIKEQDGVGVGLTHRETELLMPGNTLLLSGTPVTKRISN